MCSLFLRALPGWVRRTLFPVALEARKQNLVAAAARRRLVYHYDVEACKDRLVLPKRLTDYALDPVSLCCCPAMLFRDCQAETTRPAVVLPAQHGKPFVPAACRILKYAPVCRRIEQPFVFTKSVWRAAGQCWVCDRRADRLGRQFGAAFCAATRQHQATALCRHAGTETMGTCAF